ncbi:MAG: cation-translocating P-type ATPase [Thermodesulfovibrionales bacterium]|nr:cation-translocating P-type ATPase [Thermodesulfovibrionales bacterium]
MIEKKRQKNDSPLSLSDLRCSHCLGEVNKEAIHDEIDGKRLIFCCQGCNIIYRIINEQGLGEFYEKRYGWQPGRPEIKEVKEEDFRDYIKKTSSQELELEFVISGIRCASCIWLIERFIKKSAGVTSIRINYATHRAKIRWQHERITLKDILKKITSLGYIPKPAIITDQEEELKREKTDLLIRFGTAAFFSMQLMIYTSALYAGYFQGIEESIRRLFQLIAWALATPVMFYCGYPFMKNAIKGLKNKTINMDILIFLGSFSAYAYSVAIIILNYLQPSTLLSQTEVYFDTSAMIITMILLGRFIEQGARIKAFSVIRALIGLQPKEARLLKDSEEVMVSIGELKPDDRIIIKPGERIPADGVVIDGISEVDESMLTGESMPVLKKINSEVFAGTININGRLIVKVKEAKDTVLSKITSAVLDAQIKKVRIQSIADRAVTVFVPGIIAIAFFTFLYWYLEAGQVIALMNAVSVLVIACPCALGLATPLAILTGSTALYSSGIIIREPGVIENIAEAEILCLDKTGTLTEGKPVLKEVICYGIEENELLLIGASLEKASEHSLARAITERVKEKDLLSVKDFESHPGLGIKGSVDGKEVIIGNARFLEISKISIDERQKRDLKQYSKKGFTIAGIAINNQLKGWFIIADRVAPEAEETLKELKRLNKEPVLITGDRREVASEVAERLGIEKVYSELLPVEKAEIIKKLKKSGKKVIMVGDGINDAPALTEADAGIATGGATDIAVESADAVLMRNNISLLIPLVRLSKKTYSVIKENLLWAFSYNIIAIPLAVSGKIHPIISAVLMAVSSLIVVSNSLKLRQRKMIKYRKGYTYV